jgi:hypothetical protein
MGLENKNLVVTLEDLKDPSSGPYKFFSRFRVLQRKGGQIYLQHCLVGQDGRGREFLTLLAKITQHDVHGYTDWYAVGPHGLELLATPDGKIKVVKNWGPYKYSEPWKENYKMHHGVKPPTPPPSEYTPPPGSDLDRGRA